MPLQINTSEMNIKDGDDYITLDTVSQDIQSDTGVDTVARNGVDTLRRKVLTLTAAAKTIERKGGRISSVSATYDENGTALMTYFTISYGGNRVSFYLSSTQHPERVGILYALQGWNVRERYTLYLIDQESEWTWSVEDTETMFIFDGVQYAPEDIHRDMEFTTCVVKKRIRKSGEGAGFRHGDYTMFISHSGIKAHIYTDFSDTTDYVAYIVTRTDAATRHPSIPPEKYHWDYLPGYTIGGEPRPYINLENGRIVHLRRDSEWTAENYPYCWELYW